MKKNLENLSIEEKAWRCMRIELKDMEENPKDFGETSTQIVCDYLRMDDEEIEDLFELYIENGLINIED